LINIGDIKSILKQKFTWYCFTPTIRSN